MYIVHHKKSKTIIWQTIALINLNKMRSRIGNVRSPDLISESQALIEKLLVIHSTDKDQP